MKAVIILLICAVKGASQNPRRHQLFSKISYSRLYVVTQQRQEDNQTLGQSCVPGI